MNLRRILVPLGGLALLALAWNSHRWPGVALVAGAIVMFLLLNLNRTLQVMRRAANRPIGYVDSAVMLNAKLKVGATLLHTMALTRAIGELRSPKDAQPELYRWTDGGGSWVDAEFRDGKLCEWNLTRPPAAASQGPDPQLPTA